jgi:hypothetical protein
MRCKWNCGSSQSPSSTNWMKSKELAVAEFCSQPNRFVRNQREYPDPRPRTVASILQLILCDGYDMALLSHLRGSSSFNPLRSEVVMPTGHRTMPKTRPRGDNMVDLMEALKKSIAGECQTEARSPQGLRRPEGDAFANRRRSLQRKGGQVGAVYGPPEGWLAKQNIFRDAKTVPREKLHGPEVPVSL